MKARMPRMDNSGLAREFFDRQARSNLQPGERAAASSLLASALPCFPRGRFARSRCLLNSKVFELRTSLELFSQPDRLCSSACPGITFLVSIFGGHLPAFHRASSAAPSTAYLAPKF